MNAIQHVLDFYVVIIRHFNDLARKADGTIILEILVFVLWFIKLLSRYMKRIIPLRLKSYRLIDRNVFAVPQEGVVHHNLRPVLQVGNVVDVGRDRDARCDHYHLILVGNEALAVFHQIPEKRILMFTESATDVLHFWINLLLPTFMADFSAIFIGDRLFYD